MKFSTHIKDHHISTEFESQGHRSEIKVTEVINVNISVFNLLSEKVVQGQEGQGQGSKVNVKGRKGQSHRINVKVVGEFFYPIDSQEVPHMWRFHCILFL